MPIKDQRQFKELEFQLKGLKLLSRVSPLLRLFGKPGSEAAAILEESIPELESELDRLRNTPDRFNALFRDQGWIAYAEMNFEAMEKAIQIANERSVEASEVFLEDYYNTNNVIEFWIRDFCRNPLIEHRRKLLLLALDDHNAARYHASVPVVLSQIDGIVLDLFNKTFFEKTEKKTKHLQVSESISGDPEGLSLLAAHLSIQRTKTTDTPINLPYRNGILHGRDLGYANRRVSTKAFVTLLSLRDWVEKVQNGEQLDDTPAFFIDPSSATWSDIKTVWKDLAEVLRQYHKTHRGDSE